MFGQAPLVGLRQSWRNIAGFGMNAEIANAEIAAPWR
jgi:hypothetical protein